MPNRKSVYTPEGQTQINIIIGLLQDLQNEVRIAEAARVEREKDAAETLLVLKHAVQGNGKVGLETRMERVESKVVLAIGVFIIAGSGIIADLLKHYFP